MDKVSAWYGSLTLFIQTRKVLVNVSEVLEKVNLLGTAKKKNLTVVLAPHYII